MSKKRELLQVFFLITAIVGVIIVGESTRSSLSASYGSPGFDYKQYMQPSSSLFQSSKEMTSPQKTYEDATSVTKAVFGENSKEFFNNASSFAAVSGMIESTMGVSTPSGSPLQAVKSSADLYRKIQDMRFNTSMGVNSAKMNQDMDAYTKDSTTKLQGLNEGFKGMGEKLKTQMEKLGEHASFLPSSPAG